MLPPQSHPNYMLVHLRKEKHVKLKDKNMQLNVKAAHTKNGEPEQQRRFPTNAVDTPSRQNPLNATPKRISFFPQCTHYATLTEFKQSRITKIKMMKSKEKLKINMWKMDKIKINNKEWQAERERERERGWAALLHVALHVAAGVAHSDWYSVYFIMSTNKCINCNVNANWPPPHHQLATHHPTTERVAQQC